MKGLNERVANEIKGKGKEKGDGGREEGASDEKFRVVFGNTPF